MPIDHLELDAPSLDDVFLAKTGHRLEGQGDEARSQSRRARRRDDARQIAVLGRRAFMRSIRQPGQLAFALVFPLFFLFVIASGLDRASSLPGFPADSYVDFMFAIPFVHGALFTALNSAIELGRDIDTGFLNRLALTPARGIAIMLGNLAGGVALVLIQFCDLLRRRAADGAHFHAGWLGVPGALRPRRARRRRDRRGGMTSRSAAARPRPCRASSRSSSSPSSSRR